MIVLGIDPGLTGACAVLGHNGLLAVFDLPTMEIPGVGPKALVKRKVDGLALRRRILELCPADEPIAAVVEAVGTMGGKDNSVQTQGSLLRTLGAVECVLECLSLTVDYAHPQTWKRFFGLIDPKLSATERKAKALHMARTLYPGCPDIARAKDHNRAESILIAHWQMRSTA
ncbi:hypothetical protein [Hydrogenophaga sp. 2FB]|uniref:hypothetical protein n=1 Tax=Hydrogenophaga sp. 2FB TaxID=2502187 RepID=UPI0010F879A6|nr:hypothetical protein [Hydrogenophaga sp. 2FB]